MDLKGVHTVYFLGIGGIGMSALARYFLAQNVRVMGYDKTQTELTDKLVQEGAIIHFTENVEGVKALIAQEKQGVLFCYTPAIPKTHAEFSYLLELDIPLLKRSELLGHISKAYFTIAVAGTHGKTTTSSIIAHLLADAGKKCIAFLGGISLNFNSNLVLNDDAEYLVVEADEYDRSFLTLSPNIALITSMDADHLDIYGDSTTMDQAYQEFVGCMKPEGKLITKPEYSARLGQRSDIKLETYSLSGDAENQLTSMKVLDGSYVIDATLSGEALSQAKVGLPGIHNVENALGAAAVAKQLEISSVAIKNGLASYKGVKRRFERVFSAKNVTYIDDYAHHPTELDMCIQSVRELYPGKKVTGVFQPHLFSRTQDFMQAFADSLSKLDELILIDIYPARELPIEGVSSNALLDLVSLNSKECTSLENALAAIKVKELEVLITMGAGDIDTLVQPIKKYLEAADE